MKDDLRDNIASGIYDEDKSGIDERCTFENENRCTLNFLHDCCECDFFEDEAKELNN